jgi:hypothetical protein
MWMTTTTKQMALLGLLTVAAAGGAASCGGVTDARVVARDKATTASCDYYERCGKIGPGQETMRGFADRASCELNARAFWDNAWPVGQCPGIDQAGLSLCISAINGTLCMSDVDVLATLFVKCPPAMVCTGGSDAGP